MRMSLRHDSHHHHHHYCCCYHCPLHFWTCAAKSGGHGNWSFWAWGTRLWLPLSRSWAENWCLSMCQLESWDTRVYWSQGWSPLRSLPPLPAVAWARTCSVHACLSPCGLSADCPPPGARWLWLRRQGGTGSCAVPSLVASYQTLGLICRRTSHELSVCPLTVSPPSGVLFSRLTSLISFQPHTSENKRGVLSSMHAQCKWTTCTVTGKTRHCWGGNRILPIITLVTLCILYYRHDTVHKPLWRPIPSFQSCMYTKTLTAISFHSLQIWHARLLTCTLLANHFLCDATNLSLFLIQHVCCLMLGKPSHFPNMVFQLVKGSRQHQKLEQLHLRHLAGQLIRKVAMGLNL